MRTWALALLATSGCDQTFGLQLVTTADAMLDASCGIPDEDGDCIADDVDNCPGQYNPGQTNELEGANPDGVGDLCDMDPTRPGDQVIAFEGFNDPVSAMTAWTVPPGAKWQFRAGFVEHTELSDTVGMLQLATDFDGDVLAIEAGYTFHDWSETGTAPRVGVFLDRVAADDEGHECWVQAGSGFDRVVLQERQSGAAVSATIARIVDGDDVVLSFYRRRDNPNVLRCRVSVNGDRTDLPMLTSVASWPTTVRIAPRVREAATDLRYVVVYGRPD
jgi:hypothetical protein